MSMEGKKRIIFRWNNIQEILEREEAERTGDPYIDAAKIEEIAFDTARKVNDCIRKLYKCERVEWLLRQPCDDDPFDDDEYHIYWIAEGVSDSEQAIKVQFEKLKTSFPRISFELEIR